ncbi:hypothetical protein BVC80_531g14 [Macleaya cordata]|uniref:Uncharacterized protein n=1 Tax=Macleaya cordata TaxID=56857 RepID=A0A200PMS9_MACCD|nr:hypothetical protein BVC80_531g14 [Macleaya cordata]
MLSHHHINKTLTSISTFRFLTHSTHTLSPTDPFRSHPSHHDLSTIDSKESLLKSYTVTPPIKPWPLRLYPKRLVSMIKRQQNLDLALQIFDHAGKEEEVMKVLIMAMTSRGVFVDLESWVVFVTKVAGGSESWRSVLDSVLLESETAI